MPRMGLERHRFLTGIGRTHCRYEQELLDIDPAPGGHGVFCVESHGREKGVMSFVIDEPAIACWMWA